MGRGSVSSKFLVTIDIIHSLLGVGLVVFAAFSIIEVHNVTSLRNPYHLTTSTTFQWLQALPWIYAAIGAFILLVSCCVFVGVTKDSRALLLTNIFFKVVTILALVGVVSVTFLFADSKASDKFVNETIVDGFTHMYSEGADAQVKKDFGSLEMKLGCCGANSYNDYYIRYLSKNEDLPLSCCKLSEDDTSVRECKSKNEMMRSRLGCVVVANYYCKIMIRVFAGIAVFAGFIGILSVVAALCHSGALKDKKDVREIEETRIKLMVADIAKAEKAGTLKV